jgi:hypothetical protein
VDRRGDKPRIAVLLHAHSEAGHHVLMSPAAPLDRGPDDRSSANGHAGPPVGTRERGSFTFGTCHGCGWSGPGRRARALAAQDAVRHLDAGCDGGVTPQALRGGATGAESDRAPR